VEGRRPAQDRTVRFPGKGTNLPTDSGSLFSSFRMPQQLIQIMSVCMRRMGQVREDLHAIACYEAALRVHTETDSVPSRPRLRLDN
jgi:hypothetical protein